MKKFLFYSAAICLLLAVSSCKKVIEDQQKKAVMSFITTGQWVVASYLADSVSYTDDFNGYVFKFRDDGTVTGINGSITESGTWIGEVSDYSITSDFPSSGDPLKKLNGHWKIKDSGLTFVKADLSTDSATMHLHLTKIP